MKNAVMQAGKKFRIVAFLMALLLAFGLAGNFSPLVSVAYAAYPPSAGGGSGGGTGGGSGASNKLFDIVGNDGNINSSSEVATQSSDSFATVITKYKSIATAVMGILTITMLIFMLIQFTKLGASGDNEMGRKKAIMGILTTGIATALLGGATIVVGFFWGALTGA